MDSNILMTNFVSLGHQRAAKAKIIINEVNPIHGIFNGHSVYGIKTIVFTAPRLIGVVEYCARAASRLFHTCSHTIQGLTCVIVPNRLFV